MSATTLHHKGPHATSTRHRPANRVVLVSLTIGLVAAVALTMLVVPGATEGVTTGAALVGFGLGWAVLRTMSARTARPQRWAAVPAVAMASTGAALIVADPSDRTLSVLAWVWPPLALALAIWTYVRARRDLVRVGRWLVTAVLVLLAGSSAGAGVRALTTDSFASTYPAPGALHSVGGHDLHIDCRGEGQPTVVLINGLGEFSASWARIRDGVAPTTRVCAYDRAGQGWSDDVAGPQDGITTARDLHVLLAQAGETGPFVLVGHSIGGPHAMTYADQYADEVAGMVLLDSTSPHQFEVIPTYPRQYPLMLRAYGVMPTLARLGLGVLLTGSHLPAGDAELVDFMAATPRGARNARDDLSVLPVVFRQAQELRSLDDRPLVVLTSAENARDTGGWTEAQEQMAALSTNSVRREAATSHAGIVEDADGAAASVQAIATVVHAVRTSTPVAPW